MTERPEGTTLLASSILLLGSFAWEPVGGEGNGIRLGHHQGLEQQVFVSWRLCLTLFSGWTASPVLGPRDVGGHAYPEPSVLGRCRDSSDPARTCRSSAPYMVSLW